MKKITPLVLSREVKDITFPSTGGLEESQALRHAGRRAQHTTYHRLSCCGIQLTNKAPVFKLLAMLICLPLQVSFCYISIEDCVLSIVERSPPPESSSFLHPLRLCPCSSLFAPNVISPVTFSSSNSTSHVLSYLPFCVSDGPSVVLH